MIPRPTLALLLALATLAATFPAASARADSPPPTPPAASSAPPTPPAASSAPPTTAAATSAPSTRTPAIAAIVLPSRSPQAPALAARVRRLGTALARARQTTLTDATDADARLNMADITATLVRAQELAAAGSLDDAALLLDDALQAGTRAPHRFAQVDALLAAHVTRAAIALARDEKNLAATLFDRVLRWDPTFTLKASERSPRLNAALAAARRRTGKPPGALTPADLGELCALDEILVARPISATRIELTRLEHCRVVATALVAIADIDENTLPLLAVAPYREPPPPRPLYKKPWFWAVTGLAATAATVLLWQVTTSTDAVDVVPHY